MPNLTLDNKKWYSLSFLHNIYLILLEEECNLVLCRFSQFLAFI